MRSIASKNESWAAATPHPASSTHRIGSRYFHGARPVLADTTSSPVAPITPRHAPVATGLNESGPSSAAVPMVPISVVATATAATPQNVEPRVRPGSPAVNALLETARPQQASIVGPPQVSGRQASHPPRSNY